MKLIKARETKDKISAYLDMPCPNKGSDYCKRAAYVDGGYAACSGIYALKCHHCGHEWTYELTPTITGSGCAGQIRNGRIMH